MDLLNSSELKLKYTKYKKIIKNWEINFQKKNGRIPSKLDIREAEPVIKSAYKKYYEMKTEFLRESIIDVADISLNTPSDFENTTFFNSSQEHNISDSDALKAFQDDNNCSSNVEEVEPKINKNVWGAHLSNVQSSNSDNVKKTITKKLSEKIFSGSKFSRRNPRKSISVTKQKELSTTEVSDSSQPVDSAHPENYDKSTLNTSNDSNKNFDGPDPINDLNDEEKLPPGIKTNIPLTSKCVNLCQIAANDNFELKTSRNIDKNWIDRITPQDSKQITGENENENPKKISYGLSNINSKLLSQNTEEKIENTQNLITTTEKTPILNTTIENKYSETEDVIANSESETETQTNIRHVKKKRRILSTKSQRISPKNDLSLNKDDTKNSPPKKGKKLKNETKKRKTIPKKAQPELRKSYNRKAKAIGLSQTVQILEKFGNDSEDEDPYKADSDDDPNYNESAGNKLDFLKDLKSPPQKPSKIKVKKEKIKASIAKPKRTKKGQETSVKDQSKESEIIDEGPINLTEIYRTKLPEIVPRFQTLKKANLSLPKREESVESKKEVEKEQPRKNLNENYVRINIQKKVFARKKKMITFSKYQKRKWLENKRKQASLCGENMDMGGCDGGKLTCFTCGETGHFSRQCKSLKKDDLLPLNVEVEDTSPLPTLEEAYKNATQSKLSIHASNFKQNATNENKKIQDDSQETYESEFLNNPVDEQEMENLLKIVESSESAITVPTDNSFLVQPLFNPLPDGNVIETPAEVYEALKEFGFSQFKPGQEKIVMRILSGLSTLVTLSTGSGKSLCYQLPAYMYSKYRSPSVALVISPLISLMEDQRDQYKRIACLHTAMTEKARKNTFDLLEAGKVDALLVSPEAIVSGLDTLIRKLPRISFVCIDEVHCVSQWSHNFRPSYLILCRILQERLNVKILLGLTATASLVTQQSILSHLGICDKSEGVIGNAPLPDNLTLTVSKDVKRDAALIAMLQSERLKNYRSIIVYCTRRNDCDRLASLLRTYFKDDNFIVNKKRKKINWGVEAYHAGLSTSRRKTIQNAFMSGELKVLVATVAFGMGINKSDIRAVIHYNLPRNFESYVQEVGRAGRDGLPAYCHLFLDSKNEDQNELRRHIFSNSIDRHVIRKLLQKVFVPCECKSRGVACRKHEVAFPVNETVQLLDIPEENISTLLCYLELHEKSLVQVLNNAYTWCKVISYAGPKVLHEAAQTCAPLAMVIAMEMKKGINVKELNTLEFPIVELASAIGWESGMVKYYLKNLEWTTVDGKPKRSTISVQFSSLGFRVRAVGDLNPNDLDEALDYLYSKVQNQEKLALYQLQESYEAFASVATNSFQISDDEAYSLSAKLKTTILNYFQCGKIIHEDTEIKFEDADEERIAQDVRSLISMYPQNNFTGRAVARIFYGIPSPNYPAVIWGRCRYWRTHLKSDFNLLCKIATQTIISMR